MDRKMYTPTEKQEKKWSEYLEIIIPNDEWFKDNWKHTHHGKAAGWGIGKRDWIVSRMTATREYQLGIWQGRVDAARGLDYSEERNENAYNLGYYRGYTEFESNYRGWDMRTRARFDAEYRN
jgi:hypothetical protein